MNAFVGPTSWPHRPPTPRLTCDVSGGHDWGGWVPTRLDGQVTTEMARYCRRAGCGAQESDTVTPPEEASR